MLGGQVAFEHLHLLAAVETDQVVALDRGPHRYGGVGHFLDRFAIVTEVRERAVDLRDQRRNFVNGDAVIADMGSDDVAG